jgi:hypothetical protein
MLAAISKHGQISTLELEENLNAVRINFPRKIYEDIDIFITSDYNFIFVKDQPNQFIEVWNVDSKIMSYKVQSEIQGRFVLCTSADSKFLFYGSDNNEIS